MTVRDPRFNIQTIDGWDSYPSRRGENVEVPFRHGSFYVGRKYYQPRGFSLAIMVFPVNTSGVVAHTNGGRAHIRENISALMGELYSNDLISVQRDEPDYPGAGIVTYEAMCEVTDVVPVQSNIGALDRLFAPRFNMPVPFWRVLPKKTGQSTPSVSNGGNAPVTDMVITLTGGTNPVLTNTTTGEILTVTDAMAAPVIVDVGARTVTQSGAAADALLEPSEDHWMEFVPGTNSLTLGGGGSVSIDFYDKEF